MPSWKKVIISGSNADLLTVTASFKGNLTGTASVATTASYVNPLNQNVIITGSATNSLLVKGSGATSATTALLIQNSSATTSMVVLDNGNIGIGTAAPAQKIHSVATGDIYSLIQSTGTGGAGNIYKNTYREYFTGTNYATANSWEVYDLTAGAPVIHVSGVSRAVGINKINASYQLDVAGDIRSTLGAYFATTSGFVGIGTTSPATLLDVNGSGRFTNGLTVTGSILATSTITAEQHIEARVNLKSMYQAGDEGGEIFLNTPATNTTINSGVNIDVYQDKLRIWEAGGTNRGFYLDMTTGAPGVGTDLKPAGYTGFFTVPTNPPGQQTLDIQNGIIVNVL